MPQLCDHFIILWNLNMWIFLFHNHFTSNSPTSVCSLFSDSLSTHKFKWNKLRQHDALPYNSWILLCSEQTQKILLIRLQSKSKHLRFSHLIDWHCLFQPPLPTLLADEKLLGTCLISCLGILFKCWLWFSRHSKKLHTLSYISNKFMEFLRASSLGTSFWAIMSSRA